MSIDFAIRGPTRRCAATGRDLLPGERFHTALVNESGKLVRNDYAEEAWAGPPASCVAHWTGQVPPGHTAAKPAVPEELLIDWFHQLAGNPEPSRVNLRYVVTLLLMRRKRLKFEDATRGHGDEPAKLLVRDARNGARHELPDPKLTEAEVLAVQEEILQVLGVS